MNRGVDSEYSDEARQEADRILQETADREFNIGLDAEARSGTGDDNTGTGPDFDAEHGPEAREEHDGPQRR